MHGSLCDAYQRHTAVKPPFQARLPYCSSQPSSPSEACGVLTECGVLSRHVPAHNNHVARSTFPWKAWMLLQEANQRTIGQFDAAVLEIDAEEAQELARVCDAMQRLRVSCPLGHLQGAPVLPLLIEARVIAQEEGISELSCWQPTWSMCNPGLCVGVQAEDADRAAQRASIAQGRRAEALSRLQDVHRQTARHLKDSVEAVQQVSFQRPGDVEIPCVLFSIPYRNTCAW